MYIADLLNDFAAAVDHGNVNVGPTPHESLRHYANDCADFVVEEKLASQNTGVASELPLPEFVAQDGDRLSRWNFVAGKRSAPDERLDTHDGEGVHGAIIAAQAHRVARSGPNNVGNGGCDHAFKNSAAPGEFKILVRRIVSEASALARF